MSKSLGNFRTIQDVLEQYSADSIRMFILQTHYRSPIEFTGDNMDAAKTSMARLIRAARVVDDEPIANGFVAPDIDSDLKPFADDFLAAMDNDFNTPVAISVLFALSDKVFQSEREQASKYAHALKYYAGILGF